MGDIKRWGSYTLAGLKGWKGMATAIFGMDRLKTAFFHFILFISTNTQYFYVN